MIVLDTNVISEIFRPQPDPRVVGWLRGLTTETAITSVTLAELLAGVACLPAGRRRDGLERAITQVVATCEGDGLVLSFDAPAAARYAQIVAARRDAGSPISTADAQIAAICRTHEATCATRNVKDFVGAGVDVIDPWTA